jgi:hypothetical protein
MADRNSMLQAIRFRVPFPIMLTIFLNLPNPSSRIMAQESFLAGECKMRTARKSDSLTAICEKIFSKMWEPPRFTTQGAPAVWYKDSLTFIHAVWLP